MNNLMDQYVMYVRMQSHLVALKGKDLAEIEYNIHKYVLISV